MAARLQSHCYILTLIQCNIVLSYRFFYYLKILGVMFITILQDYHREIFERVCMLVVVASFMSGLEMEK